MDVTDPAQVKAAAQSAITAFGRLDALVNNAGYAQPGALEDPAAARRARGRRPVRYGRILKRQPGSPGLARDQIGEWSRRQRTPAGAGGLRFWGLCRR